MERTIDAFARCAGLAAEAGYDGVEVMGSEGYLINQFICAHTNKREDEWGGSFENRIRFAIEIVDRTRKAVGNDWIIMYRLSMLDLLKDDVQSVREQAQKSLDQIANYLEERKKWEERFGR